MGDAEKVYPKFYKCVSEEVVYKNLSQRSSVLLGCEVATRVLAHLTCSKVKDSLVEFPTPYSIKEMTIIKYFDQIQCHNVLLLHKILNNKVPESICNIYTLMLHSHNTRTKNQIIIPQTNTKFLGTYSIKHQCISVWNHFSTIFTDQNLELLSFSSVKRLVNNYFINSYKE